MLLDEFLKTLFVPALRHYMLHPFADSSITLCMQALSTPIRFATGHAYKNTALVR